MCLSVVEIRFGKEQHVDVYGMVVKDIGLGVFGVDVEAVGIEVFGWAAEALEMALEVGGLGGLVMGFGSSPAASQGQSMQLDADAMHADGRLPAVHADYATCTPTDDFPSCARPPPAPAAQPTTGMAYDGHAQGEEITQSQTLTALFTMPVVHIMIHTLEQVGIYLYSMALCVLHTNSRLKKKRKRQRQCRRGAGRAGAAAAVGHDALDERVQLRHDGPPNKISIRGVREGGRGGRRGRRSVRG